MTERLSLSDEARRLLADRLRARAQSETSIMAKTRTWLAASEVYSSLGLAEDAAAAASEAISLTPKVVTPFLQAKSLGFRPKNERSLLGDYSKFAGDSAARAFSALELSLERLVSDGPEAALEVAPRLDHTGSIGLVASLRRAGLETFLRRTPSFQGLPENLRSSLALASLTLGKDESALAERSYGALHAASLELTAGNSTSTERALGRLDGYGEKAGLLEAKTWLGIGTPNASRAFARVFDEFGGAPSARAALEEAFESGDRNHASELLERIAPDSFGLSELESALLRSLLGNRASLTSFDASEDSPLARLARLLGAENSPNPPLGPDFSSEERAREFLRSERADVARSHELANLLRLALVGRENPGALASELADLGHSERRLDLVLAAALELESLLEGNSPDQEGYAWVRERAISLFDDVSRGNDGKLRTEALRALLRLRPDDGGESLARLASESADSENKADLVLEGLLRGASSNPREGLETLFELSGSPAYLLAALALVEAEDGEFEPLLRSLEKSGRGFLSDLATTHRVLRASRLDPDSATAELVELAARTGSEPSLLSVALSLAGGRITSDEKNSETLLRCSSEWLLARFTATAWLAGNPGLALELGRHFKKRRASPLLDRLRRELLIETSDLERVISDTLDAQTGANSSEKAAAFEELADLELRRGKPGSAELWYRALLAENPGNEAGLFRLEGLLLDEARLEDARDLENQLAQKLEGRDALPYANHLALEALAAFDERESKRLFERVLAKEPDSLLALRVLHRSYRKKRDDEALEPILERLLERAPSDLDQIALLSELATLSARVEKYDRARVFAQEAAALRSQLFTPAWLTESLGDDSPENRAERAFLLGEAAASPRHRETLFLEAGEGYLALENEAQGELALSLVLESNPGNNTAFALLYELAKKRGDDARASKLLEGRLALELSGAERFDLELRLADHDIALGRTEAAKASLERALVLHPKSPKVLRLHASVSAELGDHEAAVRSLSELSARLPNGDDRRDVILTLARIYDEKQNQLERAMDAYEEALRLEPDDLETAHKLVSVFARLGLGERATNLLTQIIQKSSSGDEKRLGAVRLAELYEGISKDPKRAYATLDRARKAWPFDALVLKKTVELMERMGEAGPRRLLIDRVQKDAQRKLHTERIDASLLEILAEVARQSGDPDRAGVIVAASHAFLGEPAPLAGAGLKALAPSLDGTLAPPLLNLALLNLLRKTGPALDAAFPIDAVALGAEPIRGGVAAERLVAVCSASGLGTPEVFVARSLGSRCLPMSTSPLRFVIGPALADLPQDCMDYLILRAIKLTLLGSGAIARSRPEDTWPMLASMLVLFAPNFRPKNVEARKIAQARALVEQGLSRVGYDNDVPVLALETIAAIGDGGEKIGESIRLLASRAALLGMGSPHAALLAISAGSEKPIPENGPSRFRWFESHPEARDLLLFLTTDEYAQARASTGLGEDKSQTRPRLPTRGPELPGAPPAPVRPRPTSGPTPPPRPVSAFAPPPPKRGTPKDEE